MRVKTLFRTVLSPLWLALFGAPALAASATGLPATVTDALQAAGVAPTAVSAWVAPADGGPARLSHDASAPRQMASVMKLFTTGTALQTLGPAFTWRTQFALAGRLKPDGQLQGQLLMRGEGDPSMVSERVMLMMRQLREAGLRRIDGDWLLDRSAFDAPPHDPAAFDQQPLKPHNAGPDALLLTHQAIMLRLSPDAARSQQVRVVMEPRLEGVKLRTQLELDQQGPCLDWREAIQLKLAADRPGSTSPWTLQLTGRYPAACEAKEWPVLWPGTDPNDHTERVLAAAWREAGGSLKGHVKAGHWPDGQRAWITLYSPPLATVVRDINKFSNNVMARQLFLTLGRPAAEPHQDWAAPATLAQARQRVQAWVDQATTAQNGADHPCDAQALALDNGSGLSREERSTAQCVGRWLQRLWASPVMPDLLASLPIAGVDGTAKRFTNVTGRAHIKTGSLDGVVAVAGVVLTDSGRRDVVVAVINDPRAEAARPALRALLQWAAENP